MQDAAAHGMVQFSRTWLQAVILRSLAETGSTPSYLDSGIWFRFAGQFSLHSRYRDQSPWVSVLGFLLEFLKQKRLQPLQSLLWWCGSLHPARGEMEAAQPGCWGTAPGGKTWKLWKLGVWLKVWCRWREGAEAAVGSSPELASVMVWFQPGHGDNSLHAWPDGVS